MKPDAELLDAKIKAEKANRALRHVGEMPGYDMMLYEDARTGLRLRIPNKLLLSVGPAIAYELILENQNG
jgi:hypothetical protein